MIHGFMSSPQKQRWIPSIPAPAHRDAVPLPRASPASCLSAFQNAGSAPFGSPRKAPLGLRGQEVTAPRALCLGSPFVEVGVISSASSS